MTHADFDVVVVGAGIAGIAAAHALVHAGAGRVAIIEEGPPLGLTSDKSSECYRNFWPGPDDAMLQLVSHSIDRLAALSEQSGDRFLMRQRGYLFATARDSEINALTDQAAQLERFGGGTFRHHALGACSGYRESPTTGIRRELDGTDLITDRALIRQYFPYLAEETTGVLHVRRCGTLSAQQLGMYLLEDAQEHGVQLFPASFTGIETSSGRLTGITCRSSEGDVEFGTSALVLAAGPHLKATAAKAGTDLPVEVEKHVKISMSDRLGVVPRDAPLIIWNDPIDLPWSADEREALSADADTQWLTETFPAGVHGRPIGAGNQLMMYWTYDCEVSETPTFPIEPTPYLPEVTLRGMAVMVPGLSTYFDPMPKPYADGGFYTKARDNRPMIGPLSVPGTYVCNAFSGYGIMTSCGAGDLVTAHVLGNTLPSYSDAFAVSRFDDPDYVRRIEGLAASGQL